MILERDALEKWIGFELTSRTKKSKAEESDELQEPSSSTTTVLKNTSPAETSAKKEKEDSPDSDATLLGSSIEPGALFDNSALVCLHGKINPVGALYAKRISVVRIFFSSSFLVSS